jgi:putative toxin-antitoxin system antitoxin component (TIGR02293 family)
VATHPAKPSHAESELRRVWELLGGPRVLSSPVATPLDAHELIMHGLPSSALDHLLRNLVSIQKTKSLEKAVGMSLRTYQRRREVPTKPLSRELSGRTWKFAEILARATDIFGSQADAERWLESPATGLDQRRPIDLLATPTGVQLVEDHLDRLEYGVYA